MAWVILTAAGLLEIVWALALKESNGFTKLWPSVIGVSFSMLSFVLLTFALREVPVGTGYAVWVGIGAAGVVTARHRPGRSRVRGPTGLRRGDHRRSGGAEAPGSLSPPARRGHRSRPSRPPPQRGGLDTDVREAKLRQPHTGIPTTGH